MTFPHRTLSRLCVAAIVSTLYLLIPVGAAAHTELETATPAADSLVPSPFSGPIVLTFSEALAEGSNAELIGPGSEVVASATVDGPAAEMSFALGAPLDPGDYEIQWAGVALDGHVERGVVAFTVAPTTATQAPSPEPTPTPLAATPPASASAEPRSPDPQPSPTPTGTAETVGTSDVVLPIVVALLIVALGAAYLLSRRNRPTI